MKELSAAVQAASTAGSVARAGGKAAASTIQAGAGAAAGTAAEGGIAAVGASVASSIGSAAAIAAPVALAVAGAVALQEIFARLTGIGEGMTGAMVGWYDAVEAARKSTEKIAQMQENQKARREFIEKEAEQIHKGAEGRRTIIEATEEDIKTRHMGEDTNPELDKFVKDQIKINEARLAAGKKQEEHLKFETAAGRGRTETHEEKAPQKGLFESITGAFSAADITHAALSGAGGISGGPGEVAQAALAGSAGGLYRGVMGYFNQPQTETRTTPLPPDHAAVLEATKDLKDELKKGEEIEKQKYEKAKQNVDLAQQLVTATQNLLAQKQKEAQDEKNKYQSGLLRDRRDHHDDQPERWSAPSQQRRDDDHLQRGHRHSLGRGRHDARRRWRQGDLQFDRDSDHCGRV
jgi:hypothetical protein